MVHEVYDRGQIVIPLYIRELLGIHKGTQLVFTVEENRVVLTKAKSWGEEFDELVKECATKNVDLSPKKLKRMYKERMLKRASRWL